MMGMEDLNAGQEEQENGLVAEMLTAYDDNPNTNGDFFTLDDEEAKAAIEREIWIEEENMDDVDVNGSASSLFYSEDFPVLPDFPCMSSSSSSSSTPAPFKAAVSSSASTASSSSSSAAASWSVLRSDSDDATAVPPPGGDTGDCMDVMENFGYMDLIDVNDMWDPSSIFEEENISQQNQQVEEHREEGVQFDELGTMFFEWLKNNKEHISAQDMRSIKLKRSTVESALKHLGTSKEGKKQLLKLILQWVEQYQLQKKRNTTEPPISQFPCQYQNPNPNPNPNSVLIDPSTTFPPPSWIPPPYVAAGSAQTPVPPGFYMADSNSDVTNLNPTLSFHHYPPPAEYQMIDSTPPWPNPQFTMGSQYNQYTENINTNIVPDSTMNPHSVGVYGDQYPYQVFGENGERLLRLGASATKEARKKRMARQRRTNSLHHSRHHHQHHSNNNHDQNQNQAVADQNLRLGGDQYCGNNGQSNAGAWVYMPCGSSVSTVGMMPPAMAAPVALKRTGVQNYHRQAAADRRQGWKQEKNLKLLLQKVLKQSDVGNLGRIVLPKKEAEAHLPPLETRDGITIPMEDIGTSCVWNMRYRFWPNNKSRMYVLENTGEFVRANGLQDGDFIVLYSDIKCGKYLMRGVKVRQAGPKPEGKKTARRNQRSSAANGSSSLPPKQSGK